ncbi:MAG: hypothetical protein FWC79_02315 [Oscillospiraceae bacterium]|nr:hypothetical protein [Oscillospiraceae bacterium]
MNIDELLNIKKQLGIIAEKRKELDEAMVDGYYTYGEEVYNEIWKEVEELEGQLDCGELSFIDAKDDFLSKLIRDHHIGEEENPQQMFKKLLELYGENHLANHIERISYEEDEDYEYGEDEEIEDHEYDEDEEVISEDSVRIPFVYYISGHEDELIDLVTDEDLKGKLLESRLQGIQRSDGLEEYFRKRFSDGKNIELHDGTYFEYNDPNVSNIIRDLHFLGILKDEEFYTVLLECKDDTGKNIIDSDTLKKYIPVKVLENEEVGDAVTEFLNSSGTPLSEKAAKLDLEEAEAGRISAEEDLIDKDNELEGEEVGG